MSITRGYTKNTYNNSKLARKYVIIRHKDNKINFLTDRNITKYIWTDRLYKAKCYGDLSAAEVKAKNLTYEINTKDIIEVKYITSNLKLAEPIRRRYYDR